MSNTLFERILVAVDESESSGRAAQAGAQLAAQLGAKLGLLHVVQPPIPYGPEIVAMTPEAREDALRRGHMLLRERREEISEPQDVDLILNVGSADEQIVEAADQWRADLLVIGDHNRGRFSTWFLGSTAEQVVRHSHCPVLVARPRPQKGSVATTQPLVASTLRD